MTSEIFPADRRRTADARSVGTQSTDMRSIAPLSAITRRAHSRRVACMIARAIPVLKLASVAVLSGLAMVAPLHTIDAQGQQPPVPPAIPRAPRSVAPSVRPVPPTPPSLPTTPFAADVFGYDVQALTRAATELSQSRARSAQLDAVRATMNSADVMQFARDSRDFALQSLDVAGFAQLARIDAQTLRGDLLSTRSSDLLAWSGTTARRLPPEASHADDPADSLYREGRKALSDDSYRRAADLFRRIRDQYPKSVYTPDAPYWEAFALQRLGTPDALREAQVALSWQEKQFPKATTRSDAAALSTRIEGALARRGDKVAAQTLYGRAESASNDGCPKQNDDERVDALNALMQVDAERAVPILKKVLARREPCTQNMRRTAVWLIASRKVPDAADVLVNVAKNDPDKDVREQAVFWLSNVPTEEAVSMLIDLAKGGSDIDLRKRAVYALSRSKSPKAAATLRDIAADANAPIDLRRDALGWYMSSAGRTMDDPMSFLKEMYVKSDEPQLKSRVLSVIAQQKTAASRDFLMSTAQNPKESLQTRRAIIGTFWMLDITPAQVATIYEKSSEIEIKRQLLSAMVWRGRGGEHSADIEPLLQIARNEKNLELRKEAIAQISRSKDPRALAFLQELIEK